ncbi:MAG: hypothetical protein ACMXX6_00020 [Candidatus Woesearchaeota archaeon]
MPIFGIDTNISTLPIKEIKSMRAQGMDNNQIIQTLQKDGHSSSEIFEAMNQADLPVKDSSTPKVEITQSSSDNQSSSTEEIVEAIIDEKWNELLKDLNKVIEWKDSTNTKLISLEQKFDSLKEEFDKIHTAVLNKVDAYDKNISLVGAEVKAMERVFSKVLPLFTENVAELSRISKEFKETKKEELKELKSKK